MAKDSAQQFDVHDPREQSSLSNTKEDTSGKQAMVRLHNAHECHHNAPCNHDRRQPDAGPQLLEQHITRNFESAIGKEERGQAPVVLSASQAKVFGEALDLRISNVPTIEKAELQAVSEVFHVGA